jgi:uncharacterized protein YjbI with pentapeptide repeats
MKEQNSFTLMQPKLPKALNTVQPAETINDDDSYSGCLFEHCRFSGKARRLNINFSVLRGVRFEGVLPAAQLDDVLFDGCDFSNADFSDTMLLRVEFKNCRMTGVNFSGAVLKDIKLEDCSAKYANFHFSRFERVVFSSCNCSDADFGEAAFNMVKFEQSILVQAQMSGTSLSGIDLTSCEIDGLGARPQDLRGVVLTSNQAVTAAKIIGAIIKG